MKWVETAFDKTPVPYSDGNTVENVKNSYLLVGSRKLWLPLIVLQWKEEFSELSLSDIFCIMGYVYFFHS